MKVPLYIWLHARSIFAFPRDIPNKGKIDLFLPKVNTLVYVSHGFLSFNLEEISTTNFFLIKANKMYLSPRENAAYCTLSKIYKILFIPNY